MYLEERPQILKFSSSLERNKACFTFSDTCLRIQFEFPVRRDPVRIRKL